MERKWQLVSVGVISAAAAGCAALALNSYLTSSSRKRSQRRRKALTEAIISQSMANQPPCYISVISESSQWTSKMEHKMEKLLAEHPFMGFDMEWYTPRNGDPPRPVALIQLAFCNGWCVLFRLNELKRLPSCVEEALTDSSVVKLGVGVFDDARKLQSDTGIALRGALDLRHYIGEFRPNLQKHGLAGLALSFLGIAMDKASYVRASNWEDPVLSQRQVVYAANDALMALNILMQITLESLPEDSSIENLSDLAKEAYRVAKRYYGVPYKFSRKIKKDSPQKVVSNTSKKDPSKKMSARKSKLYHNAILEAPDGKPLCTCDEGKAEWYVEKGLGQLMSEDPYTVRLNFEPAGRPEGKAGDYYLSFKENVCVVCGKDESYLRKYVVPKEYRTHFPEVMREHQSHDILLMCVYCHQTSNLADLSLRRTLAEECGAPIGTEEDVKVRENFELKQARSAARAIIKNNGKGPIPAARIKELEDTIKKFYKVEVLDNEVLERASNADTIMFNEEYVPHGKRVVEFYSQNGGILKLEKKWRQHFLDTMKPKHLPDLWSVDHQQERLEVRVAENRIDLSDYRKATGVTEK